LKRESYFVCLVYGTEVNNRSSTLNKHIKDKYPEVAVIQAKAAKEAKAEKDAAEKDPANRTCIIRSVVIPV